MATSFGVVENKVSEAEFFLTKISDAKLNIFSVRCYFSAFLSATRSITYALQKSMNNIPGFNEWYRKHREKLKLNEIAKFMFNARNESEHEDKYHIVSGGTLIDKQGVLIAKYYFHYLGLIETTELINVPKEDVYSVCFQHFIQLLEIVYDCFSKFGNIIDPQQYYTEKNINKLGKTVEDIEEELGYPRGWTKVDDVPENERINIIRETSVEYSGIGWIFQKYLNKNIPEVSY